MSPLRAVLTVSLFLCCGCGYHLVNAQGGGPAPALRLGEIVDATPWGDLGLHARDRLRVALTQRNRPLLVEQPGAPVMRGRLSAPSDVAAGYDGHRFETASEVTVVLALRLENERGEVLWHSGPIRRIVPWYRGRTPVDSLAARRTAGESAVDAVVKEGIRRLLAAPPREERS